MSRSPLSLQLSTAGRTAWRTVAPVGLRRGFQPVIRRLMERRVAAALRGSPLPHAPGPLIVSGLLAEAKGVSEGARLSLRAFAAAGLDPLAHDLRSLFARGAVAGALPVAAPGGVWFLHVNAPEAIQALGRLDPASWRDRYRIGYWAYELPRVPAEWVRIASAFHEIWAPSRFVADALQASGIKTPVRLMPHPVALGEPPARADRNALGIPDTAFAVLALGDLQSSAARKNLAGAIDIFREAFPVAGEALLIVKVREEGAHPAFLAQARRAAAGRSDVRFMTGDLAAPEMRRLVASCDLLLSPHRAEGFGLPLAEAFLAGVPALATGWSGNLDFMAATPDLLIRHDLVSVRDPYRVYRAVGLQWAEPDTQDAARKLRGLAGAPALRRELAEQGRKAVEAFNLPWRREALLGRPVGQLSGPDATVVAG